MWLSLNVGGLTLRPALYDALYPPDDPERADRRALDVHIYRARRALRGSSYRIVTVRRVGWIFESVPPKEMLRRQCG